MKAHGETEKNQEVEDTYLTKQFLKEHLTVHTFT